MLYFVVCKVQDQGQDGLEDGLRGVKVEAIVSSSR